MSEPPIQRMLPQTAARSAAFAAMSNSPIQRLLPQAADAERGVLGSLLLQPDLIDEMQARLPLSAFHIPAHGVIYEQLVAMREARLAIDIITLTNRLRDFGRLEECGGPSFISELFTLLPTAANLGHYADIVANKALFRGIIAACTHAARESYEVQDQDPSTLLETTVSRLLEIGANGADAETVKPINDFAVAALDEIEYAYKNRGGTVGLSTGFVDLDRMTGGWQKSFTTYVGARPAMGKSSIGLNFAAHVAAHTAAEGAPVLFFSLEMTGTQLAKRMICTLAEINQQRVRDGFLSKERDWEKLHAAARAVASQRLFIDETAALTILDFRGRTRRWVKAQRRKNGVRADGKPDGLIIIDYLQRMKGSGKRADDARYLELQQIAQGISQTAKELGVPILILAQLKRPKDKRPDTEPDMSEFRECGDIEQEAHTVALLHRPIYYVKHNSDKQTALAEEMEERFKREARWKGANADEVSFSTADLEKYAKLIIDKQREGPVGPIDLRFIADYTRFETWDPERQRYSNNPEHRQKPVEER